MMPARRRAFLVIAALLTLSLASLAAALAAGSVPIPLREVFAVLGGADSTARTIILDLRLPRALAGFAVGGLLALAGCLMQVLLRNPLADPYVLGISGGAGVGALAAMLFGLPLLLINGGALIGALAAMLLVFGLAHGEGVWTQTRLLLTGVVVAAGCGAMVALILTLAPEQKVHGMLFWLMGDVAQAAQAWPSGVALIVCLGVSLPIAREMNVLARGEALAATLGVRVASLRRQVYFTASLATACAVTTAGSIGFVGLVVPHLMRLSLGPAAGNDQRLLLPAASLAGGSLLTLADTAARTLAAPIQLPVGVLTALFGVPLFLYLLQRSVRT